MELKLAWLRFSYQTLGMTLIHQTAALVLGMAMALFAMAAERQATPNFGGDELPDPPAQKKAWQIPQSSLPESYVSATSALFDQGMADPRGCEYREIKVGTGNVWNGDGGVVETHGWLFPGDGPERFAVCWNGLVYPVVAAGEPADWRADAAAAMGEPGQRYGFVQPEPATVAWNTCFPVKGCLILRLGDTKLAEEFWTAQQLANHRPRLSWGKKAPPGIAGRSRSSPLMRPIPINFGLRTGPGRCLTAPSARTCGAMTDWPC